MFGSITQRERPEEKGRPLDFMGFQFYHDKTILRRKHHVELHTEKSTVSQKKEKITCTMQPQFCHMGYLSNTDTYDMYLQRVKPYVNVKKLKKIVSKHSKRRSEKNMKIKKCSELKQNNQRSSTQQRHRQRCIRTQYQENATKEDADGKKSHRMACERSVKCHGSEYDRLTLMAGGCCIQHNRNR